LVSPSSTCIIYFKSHSGHVCHFAELIYARLYLIVVVALFLNLSRSTSANRIFSDMSTLTSVDERTQLTNERFDRTYPPSVHSLVACLTFLLSFPCIL
ncbi:hypothetical protein T06_5820, partial [Trichinella sp. T6]